MNVFEYQSKDNVHAHGQGDVQKTNDHLYY